MGAVPKRKINRKGTRRAHDRLKKPTLIRDPESGNLVRPHHVDPKTGRYKGEEVKSV